MRKSDSEESRKKRSSDLPDKKRKRRQPGSLLKLSKPDLRLRKRKGSS